MMKINAFALFIASILLGNLALAMDIQPYSTLDNFSIPATFSDHNAVKHSGIYDVPNELNPGTQFEALTYAIGLMLSVGTFRTLVIYAWAQKITHLLAIDYDSKITKFNRKHFDLILQLYNTNHHDVFLQRFNYICFMSKTSLRFLAAICIGNCPFVSTLFGKSGACLIRNTVVFGQLIFIAL